MQRSKIHIFQKMVNWRLHNRTANNILKAVNPETLFVS